MAMMVSPYNQVVVREDIRITSYIVDLLTQITYQEALFFQINI